MGGIRGLDMSALLTKLPELKRVILLAGSGTERIRSELSNAPVYNTSRRRSTTLLRM